MHPVALYILTLAVLVLLPLIPAFVLFKFLPNEAIVSGPFQGLRINLSGAVAAYFVIFLALVGIDRSRTGDPTYRDYVLQGTVELAGLDPADADLRRLTVHFDPRQDQIDEYSSFNTFTWRVKVRRGVSETGVDWPFEAIRVKYPDYGTEVIPIAKGTEDTANAKIDFPSVTLHRLDDGPAVDPPQPVILSGQ